MEKILLALFLTVTSCRGIDSPQTPSLPITKAPTLDEKIHRLWQTAQGLKDLQGKSEDENLLADNLKLAADFSEADWKKFIASDDFDDLMIQVNPPAVAGTLSLAESTDPTESEKTPGKLGHGELTTAGMAIVLGTVAINLFGNIGTLLAAPGSGAKSFIPGILPPTAATYW